MQMISFVLVSGRFTNKVKAGVSEILVLGEHTIFALRETDGELLMQVWVCSKNQIQKFHTVLRHNRVWNLREENLRQILTLVIVVSRNVWSSKLR